MHSSKVAQRSDASTSTTFASCSRAAASALPRTCGAGEGWAGAAGGRVGGRGGVLLLLLLLLLLLQLAVQARGGARGVPPAGAPQARPQPQPQPQPQPTDPAAEDAPGGGAARTSAAYLAGSARYTLASLGAFSSSPSNSELRGVGRWGGWVGGCEVGMRWVGGQQAGW
jgi:hypothetical protein